MMGMYKSADSVGHDFYHGHNIQKVSKRGGGVLQFTDEPNILAKAFTAKIQGKPFADLQKPVTADDLPNKNVLKIPPARHISEYQ